MATEKQKAANRANAQMCTGPTSEEGKAKSRMNALKTGLDSKMEIIEGCESQEEREALTAAWYARFPPATEQESYLLDTAIAAEWMQRRYLSVEADLWKSALNGSPSLGRAFDNASPAFVRVDRRLNSAHRNQSSAMKQLHALRAQRGAQPIGEIVDAEPQSSDPVPNLDCEVGAAEPRNPAQTPATDVATETLNHELVSFRINVPATFDSVEDPAEFILEKVANLVEKDKDPPIAA